MTTPRRLCATLLVLAGVLLAPSLAHAQSYAVDKGSLLIGGDASFESESIRGAPTDVRSTALRFSPSVQYFILPGLGVGGNITVGRTWGGGHVQSTNYGIGPVATYYFGRGERSFYPFISASAGYSRLDYFGETIDVEGRNMRGAGGILLKLSRSVGVNGELFYDAYDYSGVSDGDGNSFGLSFGISAFVF